jgi:hypothetical protein
MKRCPTCHQTFEEEWLSFCTRDGTTLIDDAVGASEPPPTIMAPAQPDPPAWNTPSADLPPSSPEWRPPQRAVPEWQPPPPPAFAQPLNTSMATASMAVGIISLCCLGAIPAIVAIVLGSIALSQIKKDPDKVGGRQSAIAGIVIGIITIVLYVLLMIFYLIVIIAANA